MGSDQWSKFLDREAISKYVDYVMLMAYDEHWASSPTSGSVASIGWVERGVSESLKLIPKEKLILGVPFYTRIWTEKYLMVKRKLVQNRLVCNMLINIYPIKMNL